MLQLLSPQFVNLVKHLVSASAATADTALAVVKVVTPMVLQWFVRAKHREELPDLVSQLELLFALSASSSSWALTRLLAGRQQCPWLDSMLNDCSQVTSQRLFAR